MAKLRVLKLSGAAILALTAGTTAHAQTLLTLGASGQNILPPDEITAELSAQASDPKASGAQELVNQAMAKALAAAHAVPGVTATTGSYNVYQNTPQNAPASFQANQDLQLAMPAPGGTPPDSFMVLVGSLQQQGLLLNTLAGDLSPKGEQVAQNGAIANAITQIQAQASAIAGQLHEQMGPVKTLSVNVNSGGPGRPMPMMAMARSADATPPSAAPGNVTVNADVTATIQLHEVP